MFRSNIALGPHFFDYRCQQASMLPKPSLQQNAVYSGNVLLRCCGCSYTTQWHHRILAHLANCKQAQIIKSSKQQFLALCPRNQRPMYLPTPVPPNLTPSYHAAVSHSLSQLSSQSNQSQAKTIKDILTSSANPSIVPVGLDSKRSISSVTLPSKSSNLPSQGNSIPTQGSNLPSQSSRNVCLVSMGKAGQKPETDKFIPTTVVSSDESPVDLSLNSAAKNDTNHKSFLVPKSISSYSVPASLPKPTNPAPTQQPSNLPVLICGYCQYQTTSPKQIQLHLMQCHSSMTRSNANQTLSCNHCTYKASSQLCMVRHLLNQHRSQVLPADTATGVGEEKLYTCSHCYFSASEAVMVQHMLDHYKKHAPCRSCSSCVGLPSKRKVPVKDFWCSYCEVGFDTSVKMEKHKITQRHIRLAAKSRSLPKKAVKAKSTSACNSRPKPKLKTPSIHGTSDSKLHSIQVTSEESLSSDIGNIESCLPTPPLSDNDNKNTETYSSSEDQQSKFHLVKNNETDIRHNNCKTEDFTHGTKSPQFTSQVHTSSVNIIAKVEESLCKESSSNSVETSDSTNMAGSPSHNKTLGERTGGLVSSDCLSTSPEAKRRRLSVKLFNNKQPVRRKVKSTRSRVSRKRVPDVSIPSLTEKATTPEPVANLGDAPEDNNSASSKEVKDVSEGLANNSMVKVENKDDQLCISQENSVQGSFMFVDIQIIVCGVLRLLGCLATSN